MYVETICHQCNHLKSILSSQLVIFEVIRNRHATSQNSTIAQAEANARAERDASAERHATINRHAAAVVAAADRPRSSNRNRKVKKKVIFQKEETEKKA